MKINVHLQFLHMLFLKSFQDFVTFKSIPEYPRAVFPSLNIMC